jgi:hypothetical protein
MATQRPGSGRVADGSMANDRWLTGCWRVTARIRGDESCEEGILAEGEGEGPVHDGKVHDCAEGQE